MYISPAFADWIDDTVPPVCSVSFNPASPQPILTPITTIVTATDDLSGLSLITLKWTGAGSTIKTTYYSPLWILLNTILTYNWAPASAGNYSFDASAVDLASNINPLCGGASAVFTATNPAPAPVRIWGYVKNSAWPNKPVAGANVQVCNTTTGVVCKYGDTVTSLHTDSNGYFYIDGFVYPGNSYGYIGVYGGVPDTTKYKTWSDKPTNPSLPSPGYGNYLNQTAGSGDCASNGGCNLTIDPQLVTISGQVTSSLTGSPVAGTTVSIWNAYLTPATASFFSTDPNGFYSISNIYHYGEQYRWLGIYGGEPNGYIFNSAKTATPFIDFNGNAHGAGMIQGYDLNPWNGQVAGYGDCGTQCNFTIDPDLTVSVRPETVPPVLDSSACSPAAGFDGSGITFSWTQPGLSGSSSYAQIQVSKDDPSMSSYHYWDGNVLAGSESISASLALNRQFGSPGFTSYLHDITYYVRFQDGVGNQGPITSFTIPLCPSILPWIQVTGDVHSNTKINAPGGP